MSGVPDRHLREPHDFGDYGGVGIQRPLIAAGAAAGDARPAPGRDRRCARPRGRRRARAWTGHRPGPLRPGAATRCWRRSTRAVTSSSSRSCPPRSSAGCPCSASAGGCRCSTSPSAERWSRTCGWRSSHASTPRIPGWKAWKLVEHASLERQPIPEHPRHPIAIAAPSILYSALGTTRGERQLLPPPGDGAARRRPAGDGDGPRRRRRGDRARRLPGARPCSSSFRRSGKIDGRFTAVFDWFVAAARERLAQLRGRRLSVS